MNILLYSTSTDANIQMLIVYKTIFLDIFCHHMLININNIYICTIQSKLY